MPIWNLQETIDAKRRAKRENQQRLVEQLGDWTKEHMPYVAWEAPTWPQNSQEARALGHVTVDNTWLIVRVAWHPETKLAALDVGPGDYRYSVSLPAPSSKAYDEQLLDSFAEAVMLALWHTTAGRN